jgi:hypothetical protein
MGTRRSLYTYTYMILQSHDTVSWLKLRRENGRQQALALAPTRPITPGNSPCSTCSATGRTSSICSRS